GADQDDCAEAFRQRDRRARAVWNWGRVFGLGEEGFLHRAPDVDDADDDAEADAKGQDREGVRGSNKNHQLGDKAAETWQTHTGHARDDERYGGEGDHLVQVHRPERGEVAGMGAFVHHAADDSEQQAGEDAVGEHLDHRARDADLVERHQAEEDEAHVRDARVADDELEIALHQRDHRTVDDADDREQSEDFPPGSETEVVVSPGRQAQREESHRDAEAAVRSQLHHHTGEQHGGGGWRGNVAGRGPGVEGPQAGEDREADEDQRESQHLEVWREVGVGDQVRNRKRVETGSHVGGDQADQHHSAADEGVEGQLHGAVLFARRTPDCDQEVLGDDDDLVEDEEQEEIEAEEDAVDRADQQQVEGEELFGPVLDVPREENAGNGDDAGQQDEREADAVGSKVVLNAERGIHGTRIT